MSSATANLYLSKSIRAGFEKEDVDMFAALCQQCKTDIGDSRDYMFYVLDMARHNKCDVLEIIKTGRVCSGQSRINEKFIDALLHAVHSDDERDAGAQVLDLTADEELSHSSSGSYEETSEPGESRPSSRDAYLIDDWCVADIVAEDKDDDDDHNKAAPAPKKRLLKRKVTIVE